MKALVMDTSNSYLVVALFIDDQCVEKIQEKGNRKQSENALLYTKNILEKHNLTMLELDQMIITIGPGSYTGVRVALTIAKTLGTLTNIQIKVVSSLLVYAGDKKAISILDARSKKVFLGVYDQGVCKQEEQLMLLEDVSTLLQQYPDFEVVGDVELLGNERVEVDLANHIYLASLKVEVVDNMDTLVPVYMKEVEAKKLCL
ncbi:tRNA (adenosine(37)-N6)-threonylcarbamoyltransferase complex dimerization subunit type 1 TsaB [Tannockella kyphosi]|uniref:tRNA (adenosine(37)-N6)-threonylcarbamoyltransferase complex dimerization subunit type 1 TsaB n=1 Tax=Tannockella kyphosi TaxID=2899121 RepID=UPI002012DFEE|nr:tRNA (adenosine(37)-N6)-threonylcarbamoyltransferase complex dimerization subunit type 1 TsaB [Tannockella kyphosi]